MTDQNKFLNTIKQNLQHAFVPEATPEHPGSFQGYTFNPNTPVDELAIQFKQELEALTGHVHILEDIEETAHKILEILRSHQTTRLIAWDDSDMGWPGLRAALAEAGVVVTPGDLPADGAGRKSQLATMDDIKVGLTGARGGLADTGAIAVISGSGRGRLASLLPPVHIALLSKSKLYPSLPAFLAANPTATELGSNLVFIAGPSRSGDIELTLSIGVHGPGEVHVIVTP